MHQSTACEVVFSVETAVRPEATAPLDAELFVRAAFSGEDPEPAGVSVVIGVE